MRSTTLFSKVLFLGTFSLRIGVWRVWGWWAFVGLVGFSFLARKGLDCKQGGQAFVWRHHPTRLTRLVLGPRCMVCGLRKSFVTGTASGMRHCISRNDAYASQSSILHPLCTTRLPKLPCSQHWAFVGFRPRPLQSSFEENVAPPRPPTKAGFGLYRVRVNMLGLENTV